MPPVSTRLRPCWTNFLSTLRDWYFAVIHVRAIEVLAYQQSFATAYQGHRLRVWAEAR